MGFLTDLVCTRCDRTYSKNRLWNLSNCCKSPLFARYDLVGVAKALNKERLVDRMPTMWRYSELLPLEREVYRISLGEGFTPLIHVRSLGQKLTVPDLYIKDEGLNPTGSFKARGMSAAISRATELGATAVAIPSAGNAGGAAAAYAARAGLTAHIFMPRDVPRANFVECKALGAQVELLDGLITDCGRIIAERTEVEGWFDLSTLKEPYRVEGKKTMGYELAEQFSWELPDVVIYPTGGGTGLIGMWKAFDEMEEMGWIGSARPKMVSVQAAGCAPIVQAFEHGSESAEVWEGAETVASGLRVPVAVGDFLMLKAIRESGGTALSVSDHELIRCVNEMASETGIFPSPEGAATLAGLKNLVNRGLVGSRDRIVLFNTGTGLKYTDLNFD